MVIYMRKFTWNNPLDMFRITLALFVSLRNPYMALSKLLAWYAKMDRFLIDTSFSGCHVDPNVYTKKVGNHIEIIVLCVGDLILTSSESELLSHVKSNLKKEFEMTDLGHLHYFLSLQVLQTKEIFFLY